MNWLKRVFFTVILSVSGIVFSVPTLAGPNIHVEGLMNNMAVLKINGKQRIVRVGQTSPEGVKLLSSNAREAVLLVDGVKQKLSLSGHISGSYQAPKKASVSIQSKHGQYLTSGSINGRSVQFLVDTGATSVTMSLSDARRLGVDVDKSKPVKVSTAGGVVKGYPVMIESIKVGGLKASYVRAVVLESGFSGELLLGMTFLKNVNIRHEQGLMILEQNF